MILQRNLNMNTDQNNFIMHQQVILGKRTFFFSNSDKIILRYRLILLSYQKRYILEQRSSDASRNI